MKIERVLHWSMASGVSLLLWQSPATLAMGELVGHRGSADYGPENTLAPVKTTAEKGILWTETDVMLSKDDHSVLIHDTTVNRTTDGTGKVRDKTLEELKALDAGSWFSQEYTGEQIPLLSEWLATHIDLGMSVNLELKPNDPDTALLASKTLEAIEAANISPDRVHISSFNTSALKDMRDQGYDGEMSLLATTLPLNWKQTAADLSVRYVSLNGALLTGLVVQTIRNNQYEVAAWTVNDCATAERLRGHKVASIISDRPAEISEAACAGTSAEAIQAAEDKAEELYREVELQK